MTALLGLAQALLVLAVFWGPGLLVLRALGLPGRLRSAAVAPIVTIAIFFTGAWLAAVLGVRWNLPAAIACTTVVALAGVGPGRARLAAGRTTAHRPSVVLRTALLPVATFAAAVVLQLLPVWRPFLRRDQVSNLGDPVFHLNALEYVRLQGVASPTKLASLLDPSGATTLYPTAWHAVAGVVPVLLDNTSLMAAATYVVVAVAWTLGLAALGREVTVAAPRLVLVLAGALAACGLSSPLERALEIGIIPDAVGLALAPGAAAALIALLRGWASMRRGPAAALVLLLLVGLGACHPSALVGVGFLVLPWLIAAVARWWTDARRPARVGGAIVGAVALVAGIVFLVRDPLVTLVRGLRVETTMTLPDALAGLVFGVTFHTVTWGVVVPAFAVVACVLRLRARQDLRPLVSWVLLAVLYVLASTNATWALGVTGLFYGEGRRISPLTAAWAIVLAAEAMARFATWIVARTDLPTWLPARRAVAAVCGFLVLLTPWQQVLALPRAAADVYTASPVATVQLIDIVPYFTADELAMVRRLPAELGPGAVLYGTVHSGVSLVYGLVGIRTVPFAQLVSADLQGLEPRLGTALDTDPSVCAVLRAHGVTHVYVDTRLLKLRGEFPLGDPFGTLRATDFRLVDQGGYAKVYEITGCRG